MTRSFGRTLRMLRNEFGMTQEDLSKKINISPANISKYESNKIEPNLEILRVIASIFDVSVDFLLGKTDNRSTFNTKEALADGIMQMLIDMGEVEPGEELSDEKRDRLFKLVKKAIEMSKI